MNFYYLCSCQYDNLGDLVINKLLVDELSQYGKVYVDFFSTPDNFRKFIVLNNNVVDIQEKYGFTLQNLHVRTFYLFHSILNKFNIVLLTHSPGPRRRGSFKARVSRMVIDSVLLSCHVKHIYFGNCFSTALYKKEKLYRSFYPYYYLRSFESVEYAKHFFPEKKVAFIPDMCFLLSNHAKKESLTKAVAFDFRPLSMEWSDAIKQCKVIANHFIKSGYKIYLYYQVQSDKEFVEKLYDVIKGHMVVYKTDIVWYDDLSFYSSVSAVVSNRLHSLLLGGAYGAYPICISDENEKTIKIKHVFNSSFSKELPLVFDVQGLLNTNIDVLLHDNIEAFNFEYNKNTALCKEMIKRIIL